MSQISQDEELDPSVPFPHGDDYDQAEIDTWPDFEPWRPCMTCASFLPKVRERYPEVSTRSKEPCGRHFFRRQFVEQ